jgi:tetratricopeptide (TPR) repeat protein
MRLRSFVLLLALLVILTHSIVTPAQTKNSSTRTEQDNELSEWLLVNTEHFAVISNTDPERAKLIAYKLEQYRYVLAQLMPELVAQTPSPARVCVYRDGSSYNAGVKLPVNSPVAGYFQPGKDLITINDMFNISDEVSFHEFTHLIARYDQNYPLWFNEGIAEFYETFQLNGQQVRIGEITPTRLNILRINNFIPLKKFFEFRTYNQIVQEASLDTFYAQAWFITHYLMIDEERRAKLANYLQKIQAGKSPEDAFQDAFQSNFEKMEDALKFYLSASRYQVFSFEIDSEKIDSDVTITSLSEADKDSHLEQSSNTEMLQFTMKRSDVQDHNISAPAEINAISIIPDFTRVAEKLKFKLVASARATHLPASDPNMADKAKEALNVFNLANQLNDAGNRQQALAKYEETLRLDPEFAPAYMHIGNIYAQMRLFDMARLAFEKARTVAPNYAGTYLNFAVMQYEQGNSKEAEASFRVALSLYPSSAASHLGLANIYLQRRDYNRARVEYGKTLNLVRGKGLEAVNAYVGLGAVYFYSGNYEKAKEQYQQAIKLEPGNGDWHRAFADNCRMLKQYDQAASAYHRALELNKNDKRAQESLDWLRKIAEYERTVKKYPYSSVR